MINTGTDVIAQLLPTFVTGSKQVYTALIPVAMLLSIAGVGIRVFSNEDPRNIGNMLVRMIIVAIVIANIYTIGSLIQQIANGVTQATGFNTTGNMLQDYQNALATKFNIVTQPGNNNPWQWLFNGVNLAAISILGVIVFFFSIFACCSMFFVSMIAQVLFYFELAISPLFIGAIMVPVLLPLATRFVTTFVSICVFSLGFRIIDLVMKAMLDLAINVGGNTSNPVTSVGGSLFLWTAIAFIGAFGYPLSAFFITKSIVTSGTHNTHGFMNMLMGMAVANTMGSYRNVMMISSAVNRMSAPPSPPPPVAGPQNYSTRPGVTP